MKRREAMRLSVLLFAFMLMLGAGIAVKAETTYKKTSKVTKVYSGATYQMYYEDKLATNSTHPALMINDNIMVPYKYSFVSHGPKVKASYKSSSKRLKITYGSTTLKLYVYKKYMYVNGKKKKLNTAPTYATIEGKKYLMIPAKAVCKALDLDYKYVKSEKAIYVSKPVEDKEDTVTLTQSTTVEASTLTAKTLSAMSTDQFIKTLGELAKKDYQNTGVLASVTMAQAINESGWGKTTLAQKGNNIFGMKISLSGNTWSGSAWDGKSSVSIVTTEEYKGKKVSTTAKFRKYKSVAESIADHSAYLCNAKNGSSKRYAGLTSTTSYSKQLNILKKGGYCTWSSYVSELTSIIKKYNLTKYDVK